jgi:sec-independent protein translocase protein TatB
MFDLGWSEMLVIMVVALIVIGPKDLPRVAREIGRWSAKARSMAREFQRSLDDMAREAELQDIKAELEKASRTNIGKAIEDFVDPDGELGKAVKDHVVAPPAAKAAAAKPPAVAAPSTLADKPGPAPAPGAAGAEPVAVAAGTEPDARQG